MRNIRPYLAIALLLTSLLFTLACTEGDSFARQNNLLSEAGKTFSVIGDAASVDGNRSLALRAIANALRCARANQMALDFQSHKKLREEIPSEKREAFLKLVDELKSTTDDLVTNEKTASATQRLILHEIQSHMTEVHKLAHDSFNSPS